MGVTFNALEFFVTERFKEEVERSWLKGFDFSNEIDLS